MTETKKCNICKKIKLVTEFYIDRSYITKQGYTNKCKQCFSNYGKKYRIPNLPDPKLKEKICKECGILKDISLYYKSKRHLSGYFSLCIKCYNIRKKQKKPRIKRTKEYMIEYNKKRYNKPYNKIIRNMRKRISQNLKKNKSTLKYLGVDFDFFKKWIEYQFDDNMTWENYGIYWHLDHVKPCNSYDLTIEEEIYDCFNWKNYRPLEKMENIMKSNKILKSVIKKHKKLVEMFLSKTSKESASE